jgi:hypothetical protein
MALFSVFSSSTTEGKPDGLAALADAASLVKKKRNQNSTETDREFDYLSCIDYRRVFPPPDFSLGALLRANFC